MKIGPIETKQVTTPAAPERKAAGPAASTAEASAQVQLSPAAQGLGGTDGSFDAEKVERIAQAIRDGKFTINAEAIADKLIVNAEELLRRRTAN
jgi:negative regulator of flagellin synthesis FlgM